VTTFVRLVREVGRPLAVVVLDRPAAANAISTDLATQVVEALDVAEADPDVAAVVLRSALPGVFSAGADLAELPEVDLLPDLPFEGTPALALARGRLERCRKPVVAVADGAVVGGAVGLFLAASLRWCTPATTFRIPVARLAGVLPVADVQALTAAVGLAAATDLVLSGAAVDGRWASEHGLVSRLVDDDADVDRLLDDLLAGDPEALTVNLALIRQVGQPAAGDVPSELVARIRAVRAGSARAAALEAHRRRGGT
jgi:enoyl-CoA hydratase